LRGNNGTYVLGAITCQATKSNVDMILVKGQGRTLLMVGRVHAGDINGAPDTDLAGGEVYTYEYVGWTFNFSDGKKEVGLGIVDGGAGDTQGINIATG
jgi:hypothetical protein